MDQDNIEDDFLNLGWICVKEIEKDVLFEILDLKVDKSISWKEGYEFIINSFDEKVFLNFRIDNCEFIIGKYFFAEISSLKNIMNKLSIKSIEVHSFAIDVWSSYYCFSKSVRGSNIRFWNQSDYGIIDEGVLSNAEKEIEETETANKVLELAGKTTIQFEKIEKVLRNVKVEILK